MSSCVLCLVEVAKSSLRRRINSASTQHVIPVLQEVGSNLFPCCEPHRLIPPGDDVFLCRSCFRHLEKLLTLRREVRELEMKVTTYLQRSGEARGIMIPQVPESGSTTPRRHHPVTQLNAEGQVAHSTSPLSTEGNCYLLHP